MASLKKPACCRNCQSTDLIRKFHPERWECVSCATVVAQRAERIPGVCRVCGATEDQKKFKEGKNLCLDCHNAYMVEWRKKNPGWNDDPGFKRRRFESVRRAKEKSPESFLKSLYLDLIRPSRKSKKRSNMNINPKRLAILNDVQIDIDFLMGLWESQAGLCAMTGLRMEHKIGSLCAISIDRIDSDLGYAPDNVQLVCQWANKAKGRHGNDEFKKVLERLSRA